MSDYIKREDAIQTLTDSYVNEDDRHYWRDHNNDCIDKLLVKFKEIPSADAIEPKRGEWVEKETFSVTDDDPIIERWQSARCSMCERYHTTPYMYYFNSYNFCPNCGADMRGADDE